MRASIAAPLIALVWASPALAQSSKPSAPTVPERGSDADRKSKNGIAKGTVDGVNVVVTYGRPKVKQRKVWGNLVPYDKVWRTGSDEATTITFAQPVKVEGKKLPAGSYALFTRPTKKGWDIIFNSQAVQWGAYRRDPKKDVLTVRVAPKEHSHTEELTIAVEDGSVVVYWEKVAVPFRIAKG